MVLKRWLNHFWEQVTGPEGYILIGRAIVLVGGAIGLLIAILTYQYQNRISLIDYSERGFMRLVDDFGSSSEHVRIGAIARAPEMITRQVPVSPNVGTFRGIHEIFTGRMHTDAVFADEVRRLIHTYVKRGDPVTVEELRRLRTQVIRDPRALRERHTSGQALSHNEAQALIDMLVLLGPEGWYQCRSTTGPRERVKGLAWVWQNHPHQGRGNNLTIVDLFEETHFAKLDLSRFHLQGANFRASCICGSLFTYAHLERASLDGTIVDRSDFDNANLTNAFFQDASLVGTTFGGAILINATFRNCDMRHSSLHDASINGSKFFYARMDRANLGGVKPFPDGRGYTDSPVFMSTSLKHAFLGRANLESADFTGATLDHAILENANLEQAVLRFVSARHTSFRSASLRGADLGLADLTGADLTSVKGLSEIGNCSDANIYGVVGLDTRALRILEKKGAVTMRPDQWEEYKKQGRPQDKRRQFAASKPRTQE